MAWSDIAEELTAACEEELADQATLSDGLATVPDCPGFFRRQWDETLSDRYGFTQELPSFECRASYLDSLNLASKGVDLSVQFKGTRYVVMDIRRGTHVNALLVLSR